MMKIEAFDRLMMVYNHVKNGNEHSNDYSNSYNEYFISISKVYSVNEIYIDFNVNDIHFHLTNVKENGIYLSDDKSRVFICQKDDFITIPIEIIDQLV